MKLAALALLPALALAAPPPTANRVSVLLVPLDQGAEASAPKIEAWMLEAMASFPGVVLKNPEELFGIPADEAAEGSLKRAEKGYDESRRAFEQRDWADAERKLRATVKEFQSAAGALTECGHYCDALAMSAAVQQKRGNLEEAKRTLLDLLALGPTYELDAKRMGREVVSLRAQVATSSSALQRGNLRVLTRPAGARVYLDGEFKGYSPVALQTLPVGNHHLRIERPGFKRYGQLVELTVEDAEVVAELSPTPAWKQWDAQMEKVAAEANKGGGAAMKQLASTHGIDQAIIGTVRNLGEHEGTALSVGLFDLRSGRRLSHRRVEYQGDEFGQLKAEVARLVNALHAEDRGGQKRGGDPLDHKSGLEEWSGEDRGGRATGKTKKPNGDPLDSVSGMEDW